MKICSIDNCGKPHKARGWCSTHYTKWRRNGDPTLGRARYGTPEESFEANTLPVTETGCLIWLGGLRNGYGSMYFNGKDNYSHVYAWEREHGPIPEGYYIDHKDHCSTLCCNIDHLRLATIGQNTQNRAGAQKNSKSGIRNVSWYSASQKWVVQVGGRYFGYFEDIEEAAKVAEEKRIELFGVFAGRGYN